ncbi:CatB-related O-acetyltransferase [Paracoccus binzhouensis]|uniref:CatB-related O-acetyltransferase n=1 Tax=Paracoccus binzhouensis TaxID=2796149 RepID=UPI0022B8EF05|nr:CatB-related O-acetyltransferase [Paracoccus binzhouensis]
MIHNLPMNGRIFTFLNQADILPKEPAIDNDLKRIKRIVFHDRLRVSVSTQHFVRNDNVMVLGSLGYMSYAHSPARGFVTGAFCSIASGVKIMGDMHPIERVSTHPVSYGQAYRRKAKDQGATDVRIFSPYRPQQGLTQVNHDVWIGGDVMLAQGITIGTGAVIAARAVVTKSVPPYAVVGGVPAKVIKYRFPQPLIRRLLDTQWWTYSLRDLAGFSFDDPAAFCDAFQRRKHEFTPRQPRMIRAADILALR